MIPDHKHTDDSWCQVCADAHDIAERAVYDYQTKTWYHDSLTANREFVEIPGDNTRVPIGPVPQGMYWLIDRVAWRYPDDATYPGWTAFTAGPATVLTPMGTPVAALYRDYVQGGSGDYYAPTLGTLDYGSPYQVSPGMSLYGAWDGVAGTSVSVEIHYRIRTIVPAPSETRKRLFFTPVITPDNSGEQSSNADKPNVNRPVVTELDTGAFKNSDV